MKILIGCDVDPILPQILDHPPNSDIWSSIDKIDNLMDMMKSELPLITWLIRSDESVRFCTGNFASGYLSRQFLWLKLLRMGHELGWHMHLLSYNNQKGSFGFDPEPLWLLDAYEALAKYFTVRATRTGWDYGSNALFRNLDELGITIDFSALPGNVVWHWAGQDRVVVDWSGCPQAAYYPSQDNYRKPGLKTLRLIELPIAQFSNSIWGITKRYTWRFLNGSYSMSGLRNKIKMLTQQWQGLPISKSNIWAFYFHPDDLTGMGIKNFISNIERLRELPDVEFVTATQAQQWLSSQLFELLKFNETAPTVVK